MEIFWYRYRVMTKVGTPDSPASPRDGDSRRCCAHEMLGEGRGQATSLDRSQRGKTAGASTCARVAGTNSRPHLELRHQSARVGHTPVLYGLAAANPCPVAERH